MLTFGTADSSARTLSGPSRPIASKAPGTTAQQPALHFRIVADDHHRANSPLPTLCYVLRHGLVAAILGHAPGQELALAVNLNTHIVAVPPTTQNAVSYDYSRPFVEGENLSAYLATDRTLPDGTA